jgi:hypothetical protein
VVWNVPPETQYVAEDTLPPGAVVGTNTWKKQKWSGPCPSEGDAPHRYVFTVYALDMPLSLPPETTKAGLIAAMEGHVLGKAELIGRYGR